MAVNLGIAADLTWLALNLAHTHGIFQNPPDAHLVALNRVGSVPFGLEAIVVRIVGAVIPAGASRASELLLLVSSWPSAFVTGSHCFLSILRRPAKLLLQFTGRT